jgi:methylthioribose-1-phosphate isomerase
MTQRIKSVFLQDDRLYIIDQRLLPAEEKIIELGNIEQTVSAIRTLAVRGAPAIGVCAAYGVFTAWRNLSSISDLLQVKSLLFKAVDTLTETRPTAYNLFYALSRMRKVIEGCEVIEKLGDKLREEAVGIHEEDLRKSNKMGENGLEVVPMGARILTHCNAGGLATGGNGTALSVIYCANQAGRNITVYVDETRPLLQGARLTAWELAKCGISHRVITDNMAGALIAKGEVDLVILGADRIARNGDFANKIGTYSLAVLAKFHGIPFYTVAPSSTFDLSLKCGAEIPVEQRDKSEVKSFGGVIIAPESSDAVNPAFDVTPHNLLTAIITEYGIIYPPFEENIAKKIGENYDC